MFIFHSTIKTRSLITLSMQDGYNLHSSSANPNPCVCAQGVHAGRAESRRHNTHTTHRRIDRRPVCIRVKFCTSESRALRLGSKMHASLEEPGTARCVGVSGPGPSSDARQVRFSTLPCYMAAWERHCPTSGSHALDKYASRTGPMDDAHGLFGARPADFCTHASTGRVRRGRFPGLDGAQAGAPANGNNRKFGVLPRTCHATLLACRTE